VLGGGRGGVGWGGGGNSFRVSQSLLGTSKATERNIKLSYMLLQKKRSAQTPLPIGSIKGGFSGAPLRG